MAEKSDDSEAQLKEFLRPCSPTLVLPLATQLWYLLEITREAAMPLLGG